MPTLPSFFARMSGVLTVFLILAAYGYALPAQAGTKSAAPDVLVLTNGDVLHGKFVSAMNGTVTFHSGPLGDLQISWSNIKELHTSEAFAVLKKSAHPGKVKPSQLPKGTLAVADQMLTVEPPDQATIARIPLKNVSVVTDLKTLNKQLSGHQGFLEGWNGNATAGATLVTATENQYTVSGGVSLDRVSPTVTWLQRRNETQFDFIGSYGKITQPAYVDSTGQAVASVVTKTAIYHAGAERDEYFSPSLFALGQASFDHNYSQDLQLQQIYGGGIGWTFLQKPKETANVKATVQYEKQQFIAGSSDENQNLIGSTFAANYMLHLKLFTFQQGVSYVTAYNNPTAYSAAETDQVVFPAWKNLGFSVGTNDSYLNFVPATLPPTKRNSFQFTMGLTYAIHSKY